MGVTRHLANYSDTCLGASLISLSQPQLDWLHRAGDVDGLIVLYEGKIELMRQMTALQEDIKILAEEPRLLPRTHLRTVCILFHLLVSMAPVISKPR